MANLTNPAWYRGDFHAHTHYSDGVHPPHELLALAQAEGLDFVSITDHNTIAALEHVDAAPLPVLRGLEITLKIGHFNVFGVDAWPAWLEEILPDAERHRREGDWQDANEMMARCRAEGWLVSINHPLLPPWDWKAPDTSLYHLDALEIWNDPTWPDNAWANPAAVAYWTRLLNAGYRITALGGTDYHFPAPESGAYQPRLSLPRTAVLASHSSPEAILEAVRARRAYVSMGETRLHFTASLEGRAYATGADLGAVEGSIAFACEIEAERPQGRAQLLRNGEIVAEVELDDGRGELRWSSALSGDEPAWFRCDVRDGQGDYQAVSNPIFTGPRRQPQLQRFGDFLD